MDQDNPKVTVRLTSKQSQALRLLLRPEPDWLALLYGGAKGGGKDFLFCIWVKIWSEWLIKFFDLKPSVNPLPLGFMGRKRGTDMKKTTMVEWKRIIPADHYRIRNDEEIILHETVSVWFGGLDDPKKVEKFNSANLAFLALNQVEEIDRQEVGVLRAALRLKIDGKQPPYRELYTANPGDNWLKQDFIDTPQPNHHFVPALYTDNPHLPTNYKETLESAFRYNEPLLRAYRDGDWTALQASNTLITALMLQNLKGVFHYPKAIHRIVACDPSLGGDDCPIQLIENGKIIDEKILHERDAMKIAGENIIMGNKHNTPSFAIDYSGGLGDSIMSRIREVKPNARTYSLNSSEGAFDDERFANLRAEMWWQLMVNIQDKILPYPEDEELRRQLTAVRFKVVNSNGKIILEPKADTKVRLGRSPDEADAFVLGNYKLGDTLPIKQQDRWNDDSLLVEVGGGARSAMSA